MPSTKSFRSGTWAMTLLAMITSAGGTLGPQTGSPAPYRRTPAGSGTPALIAASAGPGDGSMPEDRDASLDEVAEQVAVVAGDLDDEALRPEASSLDQPLGVLARVCEERRRERREVQVVVDEQDLRRHLLEDLDERARWAEDDLERVGGLRSIRRRPGPPGHPTSGVDPRSMTGIEVGRSARAAGGAPYAIRGRRRQPSGTASRRRAARPPAARRTRCGAGSAGPRGPRPSGRPTGTPRTAPRHRGGRSRSVRYAEDARRSCRSRPGSCEGPGRPSRQG